MSSCRGVSGDIGDEYLLVDAFHAVLLTHEALERLVIGIQFVDLGIIHRCRVLKILDLALEFVNLAAVLDVAAETVLAEEDEQDD